MISKTRIASSTLLALALGLTACQDGGEGADGALGQRLAEPTTLAVASAQSSAEISGTDENGSAVVVGPLGIESGNILVDINADGDVEVQDFVIELADFVADDGVLTGNPVTLTNVKLSLAGRALVLRDAWSLSGEAAHGTAYGAIRLDWSVVGDNGQVVPLGDQEFQNVEMYVHLRAETDGRVSARLYVTLSGLVMANWGVKLTDFDMELRASDR